MVDEGKRTPGISDSLDFLWEDTIRQHEALLESKDSIDTRASFMLGLLGVILTVFSGMLVAYWTAPPAELLSRTDVTGWWLIVVVGGGVVIALVLALVFDIWILLPRFFAAGVDLYAAYEAASDPANSSTDLKDASLRAMIPAVGDNLVTYLGSTWLYQVTSVLTVMALALLADLLGVLATASFVTESASRARNWLALSALTALIVGLAALFLAFKYRAHRRSITEEVQASAAFRASFAGENFDSGNLKPK